MFSLTRITSLILAFTLGFSMCLGIIGFGTMSIISKFRVRDLERYGIIAHIPDESFMTDDPEVDILDLSMVDFVKELKFITSLGDEVNLNYVQDRYGLIFHEKLDAVLSEDTRKMPLKQLFSKEGFGNILGSVYIGNIEGYIVCNADGSEGSDPKAEGAYWQTKDGTKIVGIEDIIADFSLNDFVSGNINTNTLFDTVSIGDVLGYTQKGEDWFDKDGKPVTGVIGAFAGSTIHSVGTDVNDIKIGKLLGYEPEERKVNGEVVKDEDGNIIYDWYYVNDDGTRGEKVTGALGFFAGSKINDIGDEIEKAPLGELLGYKLVDKTDDDGNAVYDKDGNVVTEWYKVNEDGTIGEKVTGVMAVFSDCDINSIGTKLEKAKLGELLGYELVDKTDDDGNVVYDQDGNVVTEWYKVNEDGTIGDKVTGVMAVFSDCNIDGIGTKLEKAQLGELLGYYRIDGDEENWYKTETVKDENGNDVEKENVKVTGAMAVFANSSINGVGDEIEKTEVGELLGYYHIEGDDKNWYKTVTEKDEYGNETVTENVPVDGFMNKISASTINNMGGVFETLVIGDVVKEEDRQKGLFAIINPDTKIDEIGSAVNDSIMKSPLQFFMNESLVNFDETTQKTLDDICVGKGGDNMLAVNITSEKYLKYYDFEGASWQIVEGMALIPAWRDQPLSDSFGFIVNLLTTFP